MSVSRFSLFHNPVLLSAALVFFLLGSACSTLTEHPRRAPTQRDLVFDEAESLYENRRFDEAFPLYLRLTRAPENAFDPLYDESLWRLAVLYEKNDAPEKALLSLDELSQRTGSSISAYRVLLARARNYFRVENHPQALELLAEVDDDYDRRYLAPDDLATYLPEATEFVYDRHMPAELLFLGEVQKYFVYVMESDHPDSARLEEHLTAVYDRFFAALGNDLLSPEYKRRLSILLLDQLRRFDLYILDGFSEQTAPIRRFSTYSAEKQKLLVESFMQ